MNPFITVFIHCLFIFYNYYKTQPMLQQFVQQYPQIQQEGFYRHQQQHEIHPRQILNLEPLIFIKKNLHPSLRQKKVRLKLLSEISTRKTQKSKSNNKSNSNHEIQRDNIDLYIRSANVNSLKQKSVLYHKRIISRQCIEFQDEQLNMIQIKQALAESGYKITFQQPLYGNTFRFINMITSNNRDKSFLKSLLNFQLRKKILKLKQHQLSYQYDQNGVMFKNCFESANLSLVCLTGDNEYNLYIRIDTNTKGHQNWYSFKVQTNENKNLRLNICNLKRQFSLYSKGLKPFVYNSQSKIWEQLGENIKYDFKPFAQQEYYCLSFSIDLKKNVQYHISLLPTYTYSEMLEQLQGLAKRNRLQIQNIGLTLCGLAIPMITIQNKNTVVKENDKNVILITGRIHPGQSISSFILKGIINELVSNDNDVLQFLESTIIKIIPMVNPDGVVFGNFRTSLLGVDLNRCFDKIDEGLYPEVVILKKYGEYLKQKYKDKFIAFFDIHSHSTKKNIFVYGPEYSSNMNQYYLCRIIPKILEKKCEYFNYASCSFKLEQCKINTARGFFLKNLKVMAYTIESSYGLYDKNEQTHLLSIQKWHQFGSKFIEAIHQFLIMVKHDKTNNINKINSPKNNLQFNRIQTSQHNLFPHIKGQITNTKNQKQSLKILYGLIKIIESEKINQSVKKEINSDSQNEDQDFSHQQRKKLEKKIFVSALKSNKFFPRVSEKPIIYPMGSAQLYNFQTKEQSRLKFLQNRKVFHSKQYPQKREKMIRQLLKFEQIQPSHRQLKNYYDK